MKYFLGFLIALQSMGALAQSPGKEFTQNEKEYYKLFHGFINHLRKKQEQDKNKVIVDSSGAGGPTVNMDSVSLAWKRSDSVELIYLVTNYVFPGVFWSNSKMDSATIKHMREGYFERESEGIRIFKEFLLYMEPGKIDELECIPIRLFPEKCIYDKLKPYQKENTIVYFFRSRPSEPLGYMLMAPSSLIFKGSKPMIFAWDLCISLGHYFFRTLSGNIEERFFFEGISGPEPPVVL